MGILGGGAIAMWWDIVPEHRSEFEDWHSHEHMPERLGIPGFLRGTRWTELSGRPRFFVMYELERFEIVLSQPYLARLNSPTPWSTKMMPHHLNMTRSLCRVRASAGAGTGHAILTVRFSPRAGEEESLSGWLTRDVLTGLTSRPGLTGAALLQTEVVTGHPQTTEQRIRGGDATADWVLLVIGYDPEAVQALRADELDDDAWAGHGGRGEPTADLYRLAFSLTPRDLHPTK